MTHTRGHLVEDRVREEPRIGMANEAERTRLRQQSIVVIAVGGEQLSIDGKRRASEEVVIAISDASIDGSRPGDQGREWTIVDVADSGALGVGEVLQVSASLM